MPGAVLRLEVAEGDDVEERRPLLVLEAMKMEHPVWAPFAGRIVHVECRAGQQVAAGDLLMELSAGAESYRPGAKLPSAMIVTVRPRPSTASTSMSGAPTMTSRCTTERLTAGAPGLRVSPKPWPKAMCAAAFSSRSVVK